MASITPRSVASGAVFGAALTAAGVYSPTVIIGQMRLTDFLMLKVFLTASASSALVIFLARRFRIASCAPRLPSSIGLFSPYDGNLLGGLLLGVGMALTGACPGTVLPQVATGVHSGPLVLLGALLGGIFYSRYGRALVARIAQPTPAQNPPEANDKPTLYQKLDITESQAVLVYEGFCVAIVAVASFFAPGRPGTAIVSPVLGGLLIGASQAVSLALTGKMLGVSAAYEQVGDLFWWWADGSPLSSSSSSLPGGRRADRPRPNITSALFAAGTLLGSFVLSRAMGIPRSVGGSEVRVSLAKALLGGAALVVGGRIGGGCTSGHGISGMAAMSVASIVSVAAMFAGGIGTAAVLGE